MADPDTEYYIQIFLFVATILCYVVLLLCLLYGLYYCCLRACILRIRGRRSLENEEDGPADQVEGFEHPGYPRLGDLPNPFRSGKDTNGNITQNIVDATTNTNAVRQDTTANAFVDKKYYDIFVA